ncbi:hypothetical protein [Paenibacillus hamazuiensis]|nr:hypothetical protein [Paenibacillus hamazuiensis]
MLEEVFDLDERRIRLTLSYEDLEDEEHFASVIQETIEENLH